MKGTQIAKVLFLRELPNCSQMKEKGRDTGDHPLVNLIKRSPLSGSFFLI